jgi:hypothetical protein
MGERQTRSNRDLVLNTELVWDELYLRKKNGFVGGQIQNFSVAMMHIR